jgi:MbtH protein
LLPNEPAGDHYCVVVNEEGRHAIWSLAQIPVGWRQVGARETRAQCLERIASIWTDMRPANVREDALPTINHSAEPNTSAKQASDLAQPTALIRD